MEVVNISVSGACAQDVLPRVSSLPACDILVVEYGTNDAASWGCSAYDYQEGLESLIKQAQKVTGMAFRLAPSMPDLTNWRMCRPYPPTKLDGTIDIAQRDAGKTNSFFFDLTHKMEKLKDLPSSHYKLASSEKRISTGHDVCLGQINKMA